MNEISLYKHDGVGVTMVSNLFIDRYMKDANDAQLKVYFYLLRASSENRNFQISDIADQFNHTEKDVLRSLKYWERAGLLSLDMSDSNTVCGIHILPIPQAELPMPQLSLAPMLPFAQDSKEENLKVSAVIHNPTESQPEIPSKPAYTRDELHNFKANGIADELICLAESYLSKTISAEGIRTLYYMNHELNLTADTIDELFQYCVSVGKKDVKSIEKEACNWYRLGIRSVQEMKEKTAKYDNEIARVLKALCKGRTIPGNIEKEFVIKWLTEYGFSIDVILYACDQAIIAVDRNHFEYVDGTLKNWKAQGVTSVKEAQDATRDFKSRNYVSKKKKTSSFDKFEQHNYDFEAIKRDIICN